MSQIYAEQKNVQTKIEELTKQNDTLKQEKELLNDDAYIEMMARDSLGMVKQGEMPYIPIKEK